MSKILLLSAGTRPESKNNKVAGIVNSYLSELEISCNLYDDCLLYTSPSPRDRTRSRMPSSA